MKLLRFFVVGVGCWAILATVVHADGPRFSIGLRFGAPHCHGPRYWRPPCYYYGYHYRRVYPVYVEQPVIVQPRPIVVEQPQVLPPPTPLPQRTYSTPAVQTISTSPARLNKQVVNQADYNHYLQQLRGPDEKIRSDAALKLGRMRADGAVFTLAATLAGDVSPAVREAAARGLGLIGSPKGLAALTRAAQVDEDRDVRRTAQFAVDIIQTNPR